jgi:hypothetical protein
MNHAGCHHINSIDYYNFLAYFLIKFIRSWQILVFTPRPVSFIRITGTHNTANEVNLNEY